MTSVGAAERGIARRGISEAGAEVPAPRSAAALAAALRDARDYTLGLYAHLTEAQQHFPQIGIVNPPRWEIGHIGWFQEFWCRRFAPDDPVGARTPSRIANADALWNSSTVPHATRWNLPLPEWPALGAYLDATLSDTLEALAPSRDDDRYFFELALYHEDMHAEALLMTLQSLALPAPAQFAEVRTNPSPARGSTARLPPPAGEERVGVRGDLEVPGGEFTLGTARGTDERRFVFDNEKWAHVVRVTSFAIARCCVTNAEFAVFCQRKRNGSARRARVCLQTPTIVRGRRPSATRISTRSSVRPSRPMHLPTPSRIIPRKCSATCGNGRPRRSLRIRALQPIPMPTIRRRGSATTTCCAADRGRRARGSYIIASAISTGPSVTILSWASVRVRREPSLRHSAAISRGNVMQIKGLAAGN